MFSIRNLYTNEKIHLEIIYVFNFQWVLAGLYQLLFHYNYIKECIYEI